MSDRGGYLVPVRSYRDLDVWKNGIEIANQVYEITQDFPTEERFGLGSHMRKSGVSIPSNIAEGHARRYRGDYIRFCRIALGSVAELETQLVIAARQDYVGGHRLRRLEDTLDYEGRMLSKLIQKLNG